MLRRSTEIQKKDDLSWRSHVSYPSKNRTCYRTVISTPDTFLRDSHDQPFSQFPHRLSPFCLLSTMLDINFYYSRLVLCASMITSNWLILYHSRFCAHKLLLISSRVRSGAYHVWWIHIILMIVSRAPFV